MSFFRPIVAAALLAVASVLPATAATTAAAEVQVKMNYRTTNSTYQPGYFTTMKWGVNTIGMTNGVPGISYDQTGLFGTAQETGRRVIDVTGKDGALRKAYAFCLELGHGFWRPQNSSETYALTTKLDAVTQLYLGKLAHLAWDQVNSAVTAAAFQVAVWEITHDKADGALSLSSFGAGSNGFKVARGSGASASAYDQAQRWLNTIKTGYTGFRQMTYLHNARYQDLITDVPLPATPQPIPVPAAGFLLVGGLGTLAALRRRKKQNA